MPLSRGYASTGGGREREVGGGVVAYQEAGAGAPMSKCQINSMNEGNGTWCDHRPSLLAASFKTQHLSKFKSVKLY